MSSSAHIRNAHTSSSHTPLRKLIETKRFFSGKSYSLYSRHRHYNFHLMNTCSQFYQFADAIIVSTSIASDLRNSISWNSCTIVVSQPPCKIDVTRRKRMKIVTLHEHKANDV